MIRWIQRKIAARKKRLMDHAYEMGYEWAAGKLLRDGDHAIAVIGRCLETINHPFDKGARHAVRDYIKLKEDSWQRERDKK